MLIPRAWGVTSELRDEYMNPYQEAVAAEIERTYAQQAAQKGLQAAGSGAFGGSRYAVAQAEIDRNMAQQLALAQAQAFEFAQGAAERELGRQLQAAQGIGNLGYCRHASFRNSWIAKSRAWRACSETIFA